MIRQLFKDSVVYGIASILSQGIPILIIPIYTRYLSPGSYGGMDMLAVFAALINLTVALEISQGMARSYADIKTDEGRNRYASTALWFSVTAYLLFAVVAILFSQPLTRLLLEAGDWDWIFKVAVIAISANGISFFLQNQLRWLLKPVAYAVCSITYAVVSTGISIFMIAGLDWGVIGVFYGQIIGASISGFFAWLPARKMFTIVFDLAKCKEMLSFSVPLVPSSISVLLANYVDRIAIKSFLTLADVGIYGVGFRFASVVNLLMVGFYSALTPLIYHNYRKDSTPGDLERITRYFLSGTLPLIVAISLFSVEITDTFAAREYYAAWQVIPILAVSSVLSRMYIFAPGLDIAKKTKTIAMINITAAAVNIALNIVLIPAMGLAGSALATMTGFCVMFSAYLIVGQKYYPVPHRWPPLAAATFLSLVASASIYFLEGSTGSAVVYKVLIFVGTTGLIIWALKGREGRGKKLT
jgi:O-antigen/teichoic acid export membrane protein